MQAESTGERKPRLNSASLGVDSCFAGAVSHPFLPSMLLNGIVTAAPRMLARKLVSNYQKQFCFWYGSSFKNPIHLCQGNPIRNMLAEDIFKQLFPSKCG